MKNKYTPLVSAICARVEPISLSEFYSQLLTYETHASLLQDGHTRSAHAALGMWMKHRVSEKFWGDVAMLAER
jgi:hypothetical protein